MKSAFAQIKTRYQKHNGRRPVEWFGAAHCRSPPFILRLPANTQIIERSNKTWTIKDVERLTLAEPVEANVSRTTVNTGKYCATSG
ncbi:MAG: hypothetical protein C0183_01100 [Roseiflexus castenholzii]|nr:MAG: hypothetical protein C0183_01100 [Roseiflexus castenholzii]